MPPPAQIISLLASDESILVRAGGDYGVLCPEWQKSAHGTDGVLDAATWTLMSASVNFEANGVAANQVIRFDRPAAVFKGGGEWFAVESVSTTLDDAQAFVSSSVVLRRPGQLANVGQPPPSISGVQFTVLTLGPQIEEASFDLYQRFSLDDANPLRAPTLAYDLRVLRKACVLIVLRARYLEEARDKQGDFWGKFGAIEKELADTLEVVRIRWGPIGETQPSTSLFGMRLER